MTPAISVVIPTRDRPESLARCVSAVQTSAHHALVGRHDVEILVVGNGPASGRHGLDRALASCPPAAAAPLPLVLWQPFGGASAARNLAWRARKCAAPLVAFLDDDTAPAPQWLDHVLAEFDDPTVSAVTGPVRAAHEHTWGAIAAERLLRWPDHRNPCRWTIADIPRFPAGVGQLGAGANIAVRTSVLRELGGWDERLGPGTPCRGGEDLDLMARLLLAGHTIAWAPGAAVRHHHRDTLDAFAAQMAGWDVGLGAWLAKTVTDPDYRRVAWRRVPRPRRRTRLAGLTRGAAAYLGSTR